MRVTPCALAISGLDPSGGAGVYADLRGFAVAGVWGCGAVAVLTVQSTVALQAAHAVPTRQLMAQLRELAAHQRIRSIKLGALGSTANLRAVARWLSEEAPRVPVVIDPVMRASHASRGARLLDSAGLRAMMQLVPLATIVTPNGPETEALLGVRVRSVDDAERAAAMFVGHGARAALVKGGHVRQDRADVVDVLALGTRTYRLRGRRSRGEVHGTGCMLASLIAGKLARSRSTSDDAILDAVRWSKRALTRARAAPRDIGDGQWVLA